MDPRAMARLMNQMGIKNTEIKSRKVVIEKADGSKLVINNPSVIEVSMQGQKSYQISGNVSESAGSSADAVDAEVGLPSGEAEIAEEDILLVASQAKVTKDKAVEALKQAKGDIAEAILLLEGQR